MALHVERLRELVPCRALDLRFGRRTTVGEPVLPASNGCSPRILGAAPVVVAVKAPQGFPVALSLVPGRRRDQAPCHPFEYALRSQAGEKGLSGWISMAGADEIFMRTIRIYILSDAG